MKLFSILIALFLIPLMICSGLLFNSSIYSDLRINFDNDLNIMYNENNLNLSIKFKTNSMKIISDIDLFLLNKEPYNSLNDLSNIASIYNPFIKINNAYAYIYEFPFSFTDIKIGKQRLPLGFGEIMGSFDILNAYDQTDRWSFERRITDNALSVLCYYERFRCEINIIPLFTPHLLPDEYSIGSFDLPLFVSLERMTDTLKMNNSLKDNIQASISVGYQSSIGDIKLHYIYWKDKTPWADNVSVTSGSLPWRVNVHTILNYPRIHVTGLSISSSIYNVGIWGNLAFFIPENDIMIINLSGLNQGISTSSNIDGSFYIKADMGMDYLFENGFYISTQFVRGMYYEYSDIHNYIFIGSRFPLMRDKLTLSPLNSACEIISFTNIKDNMAFTYMPQIEYKPIDNFSTGLRIMYTWGSENSNLAQNKDYSGIGIYFKASF